MVSVYYSAHAYAEKTVNKHYAQHHDAASPSNTNHFVPSKDTKTCRDSLPSFLCRGNHAAGKTVCNVSYGTPHEAFYTHREVCGEEVDAYGYKTLISGDGIAYYTCDTAANDRHRVRSCTRDFTNGSGVTNTCGDGFRRCVGPKKDHNWSDWINWETKHSDDDDDSTEETTQNEFQEPTSEPTPAPSYHTCGSHETWQSGDHFAAGCGTSGHYVCDGSDHSYTYCYVTDANGNTCTVGGYYACQSHMHQYPEPQSQYMTCAYGHTYDTTVQSQVDFHRTKTCKWCGGTWKDCGDVTPYCPTWTTAHHKCSEPSHTCDLCD